MSDRAWSLRVFSTPPTNNATAERGPSRARPASGGAWVGCPRDHREGARSEPKANEVNEARRGPSRARPASGGAWVGCLRDHREGARSEPKADGGNEAERGPQAAERGRVPTRSSEGARRRAKVRQAIGS